MRLRGTIQVDRPVDEVYSRWAALERSPEWVSTVVERRKLTEGPIGPGTRYRAVDRWPGGHIEFTVEITAFEPTRRIAARWSKPVEGWWEVRFTEPRQGATEVTFASEVQPSGLLGAVTFLLGGLAGMQTRAFLRSFKRWVEAQPA